MSPLSPIHIEPKEQKKDMNSKVKILLRDLHLTLKMSFVKTNPFAT